MGKQKHLGNEVKNEVKNYQLLCVSAVPRVNFYSSFFIFMWVICN